MEEKKKNEAGQEKMTYDQIKNAAIYWQNQASMMNSRINDLTDKLKAMYELNADKEIDYLFGVLDRKEMFDASFVDRCTARIVEMLGQYDVESEESETPKE